jgi:hypothetical protein
MPQTAIPIGKPFPNTEIMLIGDEDNLIDYMPPAVTQNQPQPQPEQNAYDDTTYFTPATHETTEEPKYGEIYVRGSRVSIGYWRDPENTNKAFVQNPLHNNYPDIVYKTGDIARYDDNGNLVYISRRDHQINHMGYRVELSEVESFASEIISIADVCCVYIPENDRIILYYTGYAKEKDVLEKFRAEMPTFLLPARIFKLDAMPLTVNGKINRAELKNRPENYDNLNNINPNPQNYSNSQNYSNPQAYQTPQQDFQNTANYQNYNNYPTPQNENYNEPVNNYGNEPVNEPANENFNQTANENFNQTANENFNQTGDNNLNQTGENSSAYEPTKYEKLHTLEQILKSRGVTPVGEVDRQKDTSSFINDVIKATDDLV